MLTTHKYVLPGSANFVSMPNNAQVLCAGLQNSTLFIWVLVDNSYPLVQYQFDVIGTGSQVDPQSHHYIDTVHQPPYVWHIFERRRT